MDADVRTVYKSVMTLGDIFRKPKDRPSDERVKGIVYKFKCQSCSFTHVGKSKRSWNSRWVAHKPGTRQRIESAFKNHEETTGHEMCSDHGDNGERGHQLP